MGPPPSVSITAFPERGVDRGTRQLVVAGPQRDFSRRHDLRLNAAHIVANGAWFRRNFPCKVMTRQPKGRDFESTRNPFTVHDSRSHRSFLFGERIQLPEDEALLVGL